VWRYFRISEGAGAESWYVIAEKEMDALERDNLNYYD
jgi:hypothetical protein